MIRIHPDTDIGMNRNSSDWLGMDSYPIILQGSQVKFKSIPGNRKSEKVKLYFDS